MMNFEQFTEELRAAYPGASVISATEQPLAVWWMVNWWMSMGCWQPTNPAGCGWIRQRSPRMGRMQPWSAWNSPRGQTWR